MDVAQLFASIKKTNLIIIIITSVDAHLCVGKRRACRRNTPLAYIFTGACMRANQRVASQRADGALNAPAAKCKQIKILQIFAYAFTQANERCVQIK